MPASAQLKPPIGRLSNTTPLYSQIAEKLTERIRAGKLAPGSRLPPERDLSQMLGVNRMTLRQALHMLETNGLLERRQGDGTYIAEPVIERQAGELLSFTRGMRRRGYRPGARVVALSQCPVDPAVGSQLKLRENALVYQIDRLRFVDDEPVMLERFLIPVARFPGLERQELETRSMYEIMSKEYGVNVTKARQSLTPVLAERYAARLLCVKKGAPLMLERRLSFDDQNRPVEYGSDLYRGDRFRFVTDMASMEL